MKRWSKAESRKLRELFNDGKSDEELATLIPGRTAISVTNRRIRMGLVRKKRKRTRIMSKESSLGTPLRTAGGFHVTVKGQGMDMSVSVSGAVATQVAILLLQEKEREK